MDRLDLILKVKLFSLKVKWQATNWNIIFATYIFCKKLIFRDFPGGPEVKTLHFHCRSHDLISGSGFLGNSADKEFTFNAGDPGSIPGLGRSAREGTGYPLQYSWASLVAQLIKSSPAMSEVWV